MPSPAATPPRYDVVALATSAGGLDALSAVLGALPAEFPAAVLVMQHLGRYGSALVGILSPRCALPVVWIVDDVPLTPGQVYVAPPQRMVEIRAGGTCRVSADVHRASDSPFDALFRTLATSVGAQAIAVVLTGMGRDGADGVRALGQAGALVLAQSEASAEYASMPHAAIATGAVGLILPLEEIGPVLVHVVSGGLLPRSRTELAAGVALFTGHGAVVVGPLLADVDWGATSLGPVTSWPPALRIAVRIALASHVPTSVYWGPEFVEIANDAAITRSTPGAGPAGLARSAGAAWTDTASALNPERVRLEYVLRTGETVRTEHTAFATERDGTSEAVTTTRSYAPLLDPAALHGVGGVLMVTTVTGTTERMASTEP